MVSSLAAADQGGYPNDLRAKNGVYAAHLTIKNEKIPRTDYGAIEWWGLNDFGSVPVVTRLEITRKGHKLSMPVSAFSGLALARTLKIVGDKRGCTLRIEGSDASGAYECAIVVRGDEIVERVVRSGEFPDLDYERTIYRRPRPDEIN
jgi:hypothetical protein